MARASRHRASRRLCSLAVIALIALRGDAGGQTDKREQIRLPEPVAAAQARRGLLLVALTYPNARQDHDRFSAALPELIQFYRNSTR